MAPGLDDFTIASRRRIGPDIFVCYLGDDVQPLGEAKAMLAVHEDRVSTLAQQAGLRLIRTGARADADTDDALYQLVEATTLAPVWPGRGGELRDLEDWLHCPWE